MWKFWRNPARIERARRIRIALGQTAAGRYLRVVYVSDQEPDSVFCYHGLGIDGKTARGVPEAEKEKAPMSQNKFPAGWDEGKVRRIIAYYEDQTEGEALADDEAGIQSSETVMNVPHDLVPKVRELIAKHQS